MTLLAQNPQKSSLLSTVGAMSFFLFFAFGLMYFPSEVRQYLTSDISYCLSTLVPSLFPFVALTSYAVNSPVNDFFTRYLGFISKYLFRLPKACTVTILMGLLGGYPSGAAGISSLLENGEITEKEAGRLLCFCVNPGIAYVIVYAGATVLNNKKVGLLLFTSILVSSLLIGILSGLFYKFPLEEMKVKRKTHKNAIIQSASNASLAMIKMVSCILLFSSLVAILQGSGILSHVSYWISAQVQLPFQIVESFLLMLLEITRGFRISAGQNTPVLFYALALAFAGVCVHLQVFSFFKKLPISKLNFFLFRILHGLLSTFIFLILLKQFPDTQMVFFNTGNAKNIINVDLSASIAGGVTLLTMCVAFLLLHRPNTKPSDDCIS